ncbi:Glutamyl-tRNA(Gln) amidotransferase subunit B, mitochondrial, related [Eimeria tenella]|uniref:Glutamyl-tRNA(Gln) amidotransferase subunit B, mitochondrial, related n=1 Tax=Eimeria tenella TaxID=5802 RepID=U6KZ65_EIMTE|nr:Glutamyl-tRNA(Gln) amidotransferase subunit B, mitochondrial, related [Eimeria tenella]CDJ43427.1 Glutamyl-tRNA(Gln) amidotransferase subunit B, mitochondrial, related [Eimeria tenella]|eukprot:XP_013234177.1 Glutamyl-tRNA(Gln) amidotransferase subunit B, mitochondrial, related [Eimeria tenella]
MQQRPKQQQQVLLLLLLLLLLLHMQPTLMARVPSPCFIRPYFAAPAAAAAPPVATAAATAAACVGSPRLPVRQTLVQQRLRCSSSSSSSSTNSSIGGGAASSADKELQLIVGIEAHVQLATSSKAFCCCPAYPPVAVAAAGPEGEQRLLLQHEHEDAPSALPWIQQQQQEQQQWQQQQLLLLLPACCLPNSRTCPICLGDGGALPSPNRKAVELALAAALLMHCNTADVLRFDRKCYVYPDLAKRYQITQTFNPIGYDGFVEIPSGRKVQIHKIQLEEDTATMKRAEDGRIELDSNRAGTPLIEVVTRAEPLSPAEATDFVHELFTDLRNAGICRGEMARGRVRCDLNVSLRSRNACRDFPRVEIKNVRSLRAIRRALHAEDKRQKDIIEKGQEIQPETRHWDDALKRSVPLRSKVNSSWVFFPFEETQIPPVSLDKETKARIKRGLVLSAASRRSLYRQWGLELSLRTAIARDIKMAEFYEQLVAAGAPPVRSAVFLLNDLQAALRGVSPLRPIEAGDLAPALCAAERNSLSNKGLRLYAAALARGDPQAKQLLAEPRTQNETATAAKEALEELIRKSKKKQPGALVGELLSIHPGLCPRTARKLVEEALATQGLASHS